MLKYLTIAAAYALSMDFTTSGAASTASAQMPACRISDCIDLDGSTLMWRQKLAFGTGQLTVAGDALLYGALEQWPSSRADNRAILVCVNRTSGQHRWTMRHERLAHPANDNAGVGIRSKPTIHKGIVYYISNRGELISLDLNGFQDGNNNGPFLTETNSNAGSPDICWTLDMVGKLGVFKRDASEFGNPMCSPAVSGETVFCTTGNGSILGYEFAFSGRPFVPKPAVPGLIAVNRKSGAILWKSIPATSKLVTAHWASPLTFVVGKQEYVVFPGGDGILYCHNATDGKLAWKTDCNDPDATEWGLSRVGSRAGLIASPIFDKGNIYASVGLGHEQDENSNRALRCVVAIGGKEPAGKILWSFDLGRDSLVASPVATDGMVFAVTKLGKLYAVDSTDGSLLWSHEGEANFGSAAPIVSTGKLYVPFLSSITVFRINSKKTLVGSYQFDDAIEGDPVIADGILYVLSRHAVQAMRLAKDMTN